jgi:PIN domain nuclease of toxin-antitoxin system
MTYLDTHAVIWLLKGSTGLSRRARQIVETDDELLISPIVLLELENLYEIGRLTSAPEDIFSDMGAAIGLRVCDYPFSVVVNHAMRERWTRDPFDRIIVGQARSRRAALVTNDGRITQNYDLAVW